MFQVDTVDIIENKEITHDIYLLKVKKSVEIIEGQFFMIKPKTNELVLFRPISVFDTDSESVSFLYQIRGKGTKIISQLKIGDEVIIHGPYGNGFPKDKKNLAMIGGGIGSAPLFLAAKRNEDAKLFVGIRDNLYNIEEIENIKNLFNIKNIEFKIGGFVTDIIDFDKFKNVFACGPEKMMQSISNKFGEVYVSLESHMGCGVGACLSCSCKVNNNMKKICQDGPIFLGKEVF